VGTWARLASSSTSPGRSTVMMTALWMPALFRSPDEPRSLDGQAFPEGALSRAVVNRYERDPRARKACLTHWGRNANNSWEQL
jgi:5-methylcytosine-specific restriction enzyme A